jgi:hypothetical protein
MPLEKFQMKIKAFTLLTIFLIVITFVSADESFIFEKDEISTIDIIMSNNDLTTCYTCNCNISLFYPNGTAMVRNAEGTNIDGYCLYNFTTNILGVYGGELVATNGVDTGRASFEFEVTPDGHKMGVEDAIINFLIIIFLSFLIGATFFSIRKVNFEKLNNYLINKYQNRNYIKLVLGSITYNLLKNSYVIYYVLGFPLILSIMNIVYVFDIYFMVDIIKVFLAIYSLGILIVGLYFFGYAQEWFMDLVEKIKNLDWGIE